jgi:flagella basal body P-ring formation protein FlgA
VVLQPRATVAGRTVLLKDVARIEHNDDTFTGEIEQISLGLSPQPGYTRYIARDTITSRLLTQGFAPDEVALKGADGVVVKVRSVSIGADELVQLGQEFLEGQLAGLEGDFIIEAERYPQDLLVPVGEGLSAFEAKWHNTPQSRGSVSLDLQIKVDGGLFATVPLRFNIRHFARVLMSTRKIEREETFNATNSVVVRTEITRTRGAVARSLEEMAPYRAKKAVQAGAVIRIEDGYLPALVERGQAVKISIRKGALSIRSRGVARQTGVLGDTVEILNPDSGRTFKSVVTGRNEVAVNL